MEKFSAYRDPGTGIQPFLTPVPPVGSDVLAKVTLPLAYTLGVIRTTLALLLAALYLMFVEGLCTILYPIPILGRLITRLLTAVICRTALLVLGLVWIPVENVKRKRGRQQAQSESWNPKAGDIIVSNWASYIELLWLAFRFNPIFVLPVASAHPERVDSRPSSPVTHTPGRRTGTGSANITTATHSTRPTVPIAGFKRASLLSMICNVGNVPKVLAKGNQVKTLDDIRCEADRPIVVFPEGTTSNGRGLLRFAKVFFQDVPVKKFRVFVMCVRYDPPTAMSPTLTTSIPSSWANPLQHIFSITSTLLPPTISIRLLAPSESPSSPLFLLNEIAPEALNSDDQLAEVCTTLIAQIGKMKRTGMGWEDKANFFAFYRSKRN